MVCVNVSETELTFDRRLLLFAGSEVGFNIFSKEGLLLDGSSGRSKSS